MDLDMSKIRVNNQQFKGQPFTTFEHDGRPFWLFSQINEILNYKNSTLFLYDTFLNNWADESKLEHEKDYLILDPDAYRLFSKQMNHMVQTLNRLEDIILYPTAVFAICARVNNKTSRELWGHISGMAVEAIETVVGDKQSPEDSSFLFWAYYNKISMLEALAASQDRMIKAIDAKLTTYIDAQNLSVEGGPVKDVFLKIKIPESVRLFTAIKYHLIAVPDQVYLTPSRTIAVFNNTPGRWFINLSALCAWYHFQIEDVLTWIQQAPSSTSIIEKATDDVLKPDDSK